MRIFVGTLYTIENEYDECVQSIQRQTYRNFDHFVFQNLPNKQAHLALFQSFLEEADKFDVLVKVDADMVLTRDTLFAEIVDVLQKNPGKEILSIKVQDFFADLLIWGLNSYRNTVRWNLDEENLFVDYANVPAEKQLKDDTRLAPAAVHCKNPSAYQAFHYGVHRGLKVVQPGVHPVKLSSSITHWSFLQHTYANFRASGDARIGLASLGAEMAFAGYFNIQDLDYTNPRLRSVLANYHQRSAGQLAREIVKLRVRNYGFLPGNLRRKIICSRYRSKNNPGSGD